jgi:hypothetical protein
VLAANAAAIDRLHDDLRAAVAGGFVQQGAKYAFSSPTENPLKYNQTGQAPNPFSGGVPVFPAYTAADQQRFSPVRDDTDGLEDEQAFFAKGIPGFTVSGVENSNGDENPYAASVSSTVKHTPVIGYAGNQTTWQLGGGTPVAGMTTTAAPVAAGDRVVKVGSVANLAVGNAIFVDAEPHAGAAPAAVTVRTAGRAPSKGTRLGVERAASRWWPPQPATTSASVQTRCRAIAATCTNCLEPVE